MGRFFTQINLNLVKSFSAILFSVLLLLTPFVQLPAATACPASRMAACCNHGTCPMACCAARNSGAPSTPVIPPQKNGAQNQVSLLALAVVVWSLPESLAGSIAATGLPPVRATRTPLYARHCVLLL
jgi:hypothetical protein